MVPGSRISREVANYCNQLACASIQAATINCVVRRTYGFDKAHFRQTRASHTRLLGPVVFRCWRRLRPPAQGCPGNCLPCLPIVACAGLGGCVCRFDPAGPPSRLACGSSGKCCPARCFLAASRVSRASSRLIISVDLRRCSPEPPSVARATAIYSAALIHT